MANMDDYKAWSQDWSQLNKAKREANRTYQGFIAKCTDGIAAELASKLEADS